MEYYEDELKENTNKQTNTSLLDILVICRRNLKWFILAPLVCLAIGILMYSTADRTYRSSIAVLLNLDKNGSSIVTGDSPGLESIGLLSSTSNIENEVVIFSSLDLMLEVVENLHLQSEYWIRNGLRREELYSYRPFSATLEGLAKDDVEKITFYLEKTEETLKIEGTVIFEDETVSISDTLASLYDTIPVANNIYVVLNPEAAPFEEGRRFNVEITGSATAKAQQISEQLEVAPASRQSSILNIKLRGTNPEKNAAILNEIVTQYNLININIKNEIARKTAIFINERLNDIAVELGDAENKMVDYKQQYNITDITTEAKLFVEQSSDDERNLQELETQLNVLASIQQYITDPKNVQAVIPNIGITDVGLSHIINEYNNQLLSTEVQLKSMTAENPTYRKITQNRENIRTSIIAALNTLRKTYNLRCSDLRKQIKSNKAKITSVPRQEMGLLGKMRDRQVKEQLALLLMSKREETNMAIAATPNKAMIVVSPQINIRPSSPRRNLIIGAAFIIGLLIPFTAIYLINRFRTSLRDRKELERLTKIPVAGQILHNENDDKLVIDADRSTPIAEMFRTLRNNISFVFQNKNNKVIAITSTLKNEGKTFVSANLALSYAISGKKILLVGGDIRNPSLKKYFSLNKAEGLSNYLATGDSWKNYLNDSALGNNNLHLMHAGSIPPNPNELLISPLLGKMIDEARRLYDVIIFDTAPVGLVSDSYLINEFADLTLYIVRENKTPKASIEFINRQKEENKLRNIYLVLNDSETSPLHRYKYGYGYGYGYGYYGK